jgi:CPA2 family monovalent cation:H+ antiporter-2
VDSQLAALATAYVLIMAVLGPLAARFIEPIARLAITRLRPATA